MKPRREKRPKIAAPGKARIAGAAASLALGAVLIGVAAWLLGALARPVLEVRLTASTSGGILVRIANAGSRAVTLDLENVDCFLVPIPNVAGEYVVHIRGAAEGPLRNPGSRGTTLRPGAAVDVLDAAPLLAGLPPGPIVVSAIYSSFGDSPQASGFWRGSARSLPIALPPQYGS